MLLYYITDRRQLADSPGEQRARLLERIAEAARAGVDLVQLREKDLSAREMEMLARESMVKVRSDVSRPGGTRLLINSRPDIALAAGCDGVHLTSSDIGAAVARQVFGAKRAALIAVSCHSPEEVQKAAQEGADFAVLGPVFEKVSGDGAAPLGLTVLAEGCRRAAQVRREKPMPVLALGGVTLENARACMVSGAAGIAAIRLFHEHELAQVVRQLRAQHD
jgi:thiamine-phosphate pyrophosphorylase